jgi:small subunit ribosomal protein S14
VQLDEPAAATKPHEAELVVEAGEEAKGHKGGGSRVYENAWGNGGGGMKHKPPKQRKFGKGVHVCRRCGSADGVIRKYGLYICRRCINEFAPKLGFKVYE